MSDLKVCPFCGIRPTDTECTEAKKSGWGYVVCGNGRCEVEGPIAHIGYKATHAEIRAAAIQAWNTRKVLCVPDRPRDSAHGDADLRRALGWDTITEVKEDD